MKEIIDLRTPKEKHFLNDDGTYTLYAYDIHFLKNGKYIEKNNTIIEKDNCLTNQDNDFSVTFATNSIDCLLKVNKENQEIKIDLPNKIIEKEITNNQITYKNILPNIDIKYDITNNKVKDTILLKEKNNAFINLKYIIKTNLVLKLEEDGSIQVLNNENRCCFSIAKPTLTDNQNTSYPISYLLEKTENDYLLSFSIQKELLERKDLYPLTIDPSIEVKEENSVIDTYIYPGDEGVNRNNQDKLIVGVDPNGTIYRALIKFNLPTIGTGCDIINAQVNLMSHPELVDGGMFPEEETYLKKPIDVHAINTSWNEETANWNTMHDKINQRIEEYFFGERTIWVHDGYDSLGNIKKGRELTSTSFDITNLVKQWYAGKENNGFMLKLDKETYEDQYREYYFYSKNNNAAIEHQIENPKPFLVISYRNQTGLESYMTYQNISFNQGTSYVNNLTGNITNVFDVNHTLGNKYPIQLSLIYNTNDVVLNNQYNLAKGYKWNYYQTIKEVDFDNVCLEYIDADGTIHYFYKYKETEESEEKIIDEDGLGLTATKEENTYTITDKTNNKMIFTKRGNTYYLTKIINTKEDFITIEYDDNNQIDKLIDGNQEEMNILYEENKITIISNYLSTTLNRSENKIISLANKLGTTSFTYNDTYIINKITDTNGKKTIFSYYPMSPYRLKRVAELGLNNIEGTSLEFTYEYNVTRIKDNKGRINSYTFNDQGNTTGITNLDTDGDFRNGYGILKEYYTDFGGTAPHLKNKLAIETTPAKYTKNYFIDSSFEKGTYPNTTTEEARTGTHSLKIINTYTLNLPQIQEEKNYTFSGYIKTIETENKMALYCGEEKIKEIKIASSNDFKRYSITSELETTKNYSIKITSNGILYMDDVQLEEGEIANYHNLIENSDFKDNFNYWSYYGVDANGNDLENQASIVTLENQIPALKMHCDPQTSHSIDQTLHISGKANDIYRLSFWYKNEGIYAENMANGNMALVSFAYPYTEEGHGEYPCILNLHATEWQFFQTVFIAEEDYTNVYLSFLAQNNANDLYITNITLTKDLENTSYQYDEKGNLIATNNKNKGVSEFKYDKNNQLTSMFEPKGNSFNFEYDNKDTSKVLQGISKKGISNKIKYDENNNPIKTIIQNNETTELNDHYFFIRSKGTNKYIFANFDTMELELKEVACSKDTWGFSKGRDSDNYVIKSGIIPFYLIVNGSMKVKIAKIGALFSIEKEENGSYTFGIMRTDGIRQCITITTEGFKIEKYDKDNENQQFYLEPFESKEYIETTASYTSNGKFIKTTTDALGKVTEYDIDATTGLTKSITDPKGETTYYTYNAKEQITKVEKENKATSYTYNEQDLLEKITCNNKEYNFTYDEFLNAKEVSINNQVLVTNEYEENNGNLISANYGNNTNISYTYDELDRIKTLTKNNKVYQYKYDNQNNLAKITQNNDTYNFYYDFAERLSRYEYNNFSIDYDYDLNNNITKKKYNLENQTQEISYTYDEDDSIIKVTLDNTNQNLIYDKLGRLTNKNIDNQLPVEYEYYKNGNKTSLVLKSMKIDNDLYEYIYDAIYNITDIYKNKELQNHYEYDNFSELIKEDNYQNNKTIKYTYDASGNILKREEYTINTEVFIHQDTYEYNNNNWKDQLTKYNDTTLTYDAIGNPLTIGNANLSWYARELQTYQNNMFNISYFYNKEGIRTKKRVNNIDTNYFLENSNIIFEETNGNMLYYMRTGKNELLGFIYNSEKYYYKKNYQGDIIGIYNQEYELIATYEYDSWGRILSIKDSSGAYITDSNHIAIINPFRYRSYYYDSETNLYYLNSRYYNPEWGRFLNIDDYLGVGKNYLSCNLYIYTNNNYINAYDSSGKFFKKLGNIIGKGIKKVGNFINNAWENTKQTVSNLWNKGVDLANKVKDSFTAEIGVGFGIGGEVKIGNTGAEIGAHKTFNTGISNNQKYDSTTTDMSISASIISKEIGFGYEITHYNDGNRIHDNIMAMPWETYNCSNTTKDILIITNHLQQGTESGTFVGISIDAYALIGGHIKIGFNW